MLFGIWNNIITSYKFFVGTGSILVLFLLAIFLCTKTAKSDNKDNKIPVLLSLLSVFGIIGKALVDICNNKAFNSIWKKILIVFMCIFIITISGKRILAPDFMKKADNTMHISNDLRQAMDAILEADSAEKIGIVTSPGMGDYFESYSARFSPLFDDDFDKNPEDIEDEYVFAYWELGDKNPDMKTVSYTAKEFGCRFIVYKSEAYWPQVPLTDLGYDVLGNFGEWVVYVQEGES